MPGADLQTPGSPLAVKMLLQTFKSLLSRFLLCSLNLEYCKRTLTAVCDDIMRLFLIGFLVVLLHSVPSNAVAIFWHWDGLFGNRFSIFCREMLRDGPGPSAVAFGDSSIFMLSSSVCPSPCTTILLCQVVWARLFWLFLYAFFVSKRCWFIVEDRNHAEFSCWPIIC